MVIQVSRPVRVILQRHVPAGPRQPVGGAEIGQQLALAARRKPEQADPGPPESPDREQPTDAHVGPDQPVRHPERPEHPFGSRQQILHCHSPGPRGFRDLEGPDRCEQHGEEQLLFATDQTVRRVGKLPQQRARSLRCDVVVQEPLGEAGVAAGAAAVGGVVGHFGVPEHGHGPPLKPARRGRRRRTRPGVRPGVGMPLPRADSSRPARGGFRRDTGA